MNTGKTLFPQSMPEAEMRRAREESVACDQLIDATLYLKQQDGVFFYASMET